MSPSPQDDNHQGKPDLDQPVKITGVNKAVALINQRTHEAFDAAKDYIKISGIAAVTGVGVGLLTPVPVLTATGAVLFAAYSGYQYARGGAMNEIRRELQQNKHAYKDEQIKPRAMSVRALENPVRVTGMNKAVGLIDQRAGVAFKKARKLSKIAAAVGGVAVVGMGLGFSPVLLGAVATVTAAAAARQYVRGRTFKNLSNEFNASAAPKKFQPLAREVIDKKANQKVKQKRKLWRVPSS